jgi:YfdX protein
MDRNEKVGAAALPTPGSRNGKDREDVEHERREIEQEAEKLLDRDAIAAVDATWKAVQAIEDNRAEEARRLLQQALEKIIDHMDRDAPKLSVPVALEVRVVNTAPADRELVLDMVDQAALAMAKRIYSEAREVLQQLASEIRVHTLNLQLQAFANSLSESAHLLDNGQNSEASTLLRHSLATIVPADRVIPIPFVLAREAIHEAELAQEHNKEEALDFLEKAEQQVQRARDLGYLDQPDKLEDLRNQIKQMKKQLKSGTASTFSHLKATLAGILRD